MLFKSLKKYIAGIPELVFARPDLQLIKRHYLFVWKIQTRTGSGQAGLFWHPCFQHPIHVTALLILLYTLFLLNLACCIFAIRDANAINSYQSARFGLFVVFTGGSLFWYTYNAFLTSSLAIPAKHLPFTSPEGILNTDYRWAFEFDQ